MFYAAGVVVPGHCGLRVLIANEGGQDITQVSPMIRRVFADTEGGDCGSAQAIIRPGGKA